MTEDQKKYVTDLGLRCRKIREAKNLTQETVAKLMGRDRQSYQRIEHGTTNVTILYLVDVAKALGVGVDYLLKFKDDEV